MAILFTYPKFKAVDPVTENPLINGLVYFYLAGTTTPKATYSNPDQSTANTNPVQLDANGEAVIYLDGIYDVVLKDSAGVTLWTMTDVLAPGASNYTGYEIDVLTVYGGGSQFTSAPINAALTALGTSIKATILLYPGEWVMDASITVPNNVVLKIPNGSRITTSGFTLTVNGHLDAGRYQIFTGTGTVVGLKDVYPEWWGAKGDGVDDTAAFTSLTTNINATGGGVRVKGNPYAHYLITADQTITVSNVTYDFFFGQLSGYHRFIFDGDSGVDGDWSTALYNVHFRNVRIGVTNNDTVTNTGRGPAFWYCIESGAENVVKKGWSGTAFNIHFGKRNYFRNIYNYGAKCALVTDASIGYLIHMADDTILENVHALDAALAYGVQIKGGRNNIVKYCTVRNLHSAGAVDPVAGFYDRGDKPYGISSTAGTYPWSDIGWGAADPRRETVNTRYINCSVEDSDLTAYIGQEGNGAIWDNCSYYDVNAGWVLSRSPADESASNEKDYTIINPKGDTTSVGRGIEFNGQSAGDHLPNVKVIGGTIENSYLDGVRSTYADDLLIDGTVAKNNGQGGGTRSGITAALSSLRPKIINVKGYDDQVSATQSYGVYVDYSCFKPTVEKATAYGNILGQVLSPAPGFYSNNTPAEGVVQTSDGSATTAWYMTMADGDLVWVEVIVVADQTDHGNRAVYKLGGLYSCAAGSAALEGALLNQMFIDPTDSPASADALRDDIITKTRIESDSDWNATLGVSSANVRVRVTGKAATVINWRVFATVKPLI